MKYDGEQYSAMRALPTGRENLLFDGEDSVVFGMNFESVVDGYLGRFWRSLYSGSGLFSLCNCYFADNVWAYQVDELV